MSENKLSCQFSMQLTNFEKLNDNFTKAKCYVLALGKNQNKSYFGKDAVDAAYPSLAFVPVVGHLMETEDGKHYLGGHDYKLDKEKMELKSLCVPFGVAVPAPEPVYETVVENGSEMSTYLTSDIILWTGRYPELAEAIYSDKILFNQSMEVYFDKYEKLEEDPAYTNIQSFTFDALCLLNKSDDKKFNVEPCFPSASVVATDYSATDVFGAMVAEMKEQLKSYFAAEGGKDLADKTKEPINMVAEFASTYNKKRDAIASVLKGLRTNTKDDDGNIISETSYWLMDFSDEHAFVEKSIYSWADGACASEYSYWRIPYTYDEATEAAAFSGEAEAVTREWLTAEEKAKLEAQTKAQFEEVIAEMVTEHAEIKEQFEALQTEAEELRTFKADTLAEQRRVAEAALFALYDEKLANVEGYSELKANASKFGLDALEEKCNALFGKFSLANAKAQDPEPQKADFGKTPTDLSSADMDDMDKMPYGGLMESWMAKHNK